jgi:hypothetical protein
VIERIEQLALQLVAAAASGQLPQLSCVSTAASNVHMAQQYAAAAARRPAAGSADDDAGYDGSGSAAAGYGYAGGALQFGSGVGEEDSQAAAAGDRGGFSQGFETQQQQQQQGWDEAEEGGVGEDDAAAAGGGNGRHHVLRLGSRMQTRTLLANAGAQAHGIVRGEVVVQCIITAVLLCAPGRASSVGPAGKIALQTSLRLDMASAVNSRAAGTNVLWHIRQCLFCGAAVCTMAEAAA